MISGLQSYFFPSIGQSPRFRGNSLSSSSAQSSNGSDGDDVFTRSPQQATTLASPPSAHKLIEDELVRFQLGGAVHQALAYLCEKNVISAIQKNQLLANITKSKNPLKTALNSEIFQDESNKSVLKGQFKTSIRLKQEAYQEGIYLNLRESLARLHQESPEPFKLLLGEKDYKLFKERLEEKEPDEEGVPPVTFNDILDKYFGPS